MAASTTPVDAVGSSVASRGLIEVSQIPTPMIRAVDEMVSLVDSPAWRSGERLKASGIPWPSKTLYGRAGVSNRSPCMLSETCVGERGVGLQAARQRQAGRAGVAE